MRNDPNGRAIDEVLLALPPAPISWVARVLELPDLEQACGLLEARSAVDTAGDNRSAMHAALRAVRLRPDERRIVALKRLRRLRAEQY